MNSRPLKEEEISEGYDIIHWLLSIGKIDENKGQDILK